MHTFKIVSYLFLWGPRFGFRREESVSPQMLNGIIEKKRSGFNPQILNGI